MAKKTARTRGGLGAHFGATVVGQCCRGGQPCFQPVPGSLRPGSGVPRNDGFGGF